MSDAKESDVPEIVWEQWGEPVLVPLLMFYVSPGWDTFVNNSWNSFNVKPDVVVEDKT